MVVDIQGKGYGPCDPEIASADLRDADSHFKDTCSRQCVVPENIHTSPREGIFSLKFWVLQNPPGNSNPFCGGVLIFSAQAQC